MRGGIGTTAAGGTVTRQQPSVDTAVPARRWPLRPLLEAARATPASLALELGIGVANVAQAVTRGLSDAQADEWAIRLGFHPVLVWGWEWITSCDDVVSTRTLIADDLRRRITTGELRAGEPLPTVKAVAEQWHVATRTVTEAIGELRAEGHVTSRGQGRRPLVASTCEGAPA